MLDKRYRIPLAAAVAVNLLFWGWVGNWAQHWKDFVDTPRELVVDLDMSRYDVPEQKDVKKDIPLPQDNSAAGGKAGTVLPDLSGKPAPGLKDLNPYLGGNEPAPVNVRGNTDNPPGLPGSGNVPGPGGGPAGNNGLGEDGPGDQGGDPGTGTEEGTGSYDSSGYIARVEANKVMPQQAIRRGLTGTVSFLITFDENGNFSDAEMIAGSGSNILDSEAYSLVSSQGGISNTTGRAVTIEVHVEYSFNS